MKQEFYNRLTDVSGAENILTDEPMSRHTSFQIGGAADYFVTPCEGAEVQKVITLCREYQMPYYILGNGSNLLVSDQGYRGVIIQLGKKMNEIKIEGEMIKAQAGALLSTVSALAGKHALTGIEFASGIPGTIGGAVVMNAGAYGGEMKDILHSVTVLTEDNEIKILTGEELELDYRTSVVSKKGYTALEAEICLKKGDIEEIKDRMDDLKARRISKQPLALPSAGSTFKRPEGYFAGKLIQDAGLKGMKVGGAQVSEQHSGFIVNQGEATAHDVAQLIDLVIVRVREQFGVTLEPEVKRLGEF